MSDEFPKIFRRKNRWTTTAIVVVGITLACASSLWSAPADKKDGTLVFALLLAPLLAAMALAHTRTFSKTTLSEDGIAVSNGIWTRRLQADEIAGYRWTSNVVQFVPKNAPKKILEADPQILDEAKNVPWLAALRDLGQDEADRYRAQTEANALLGATPTERLSRDRAARWIAIGSTLTAAPIMFLCAAILPSGWPVMGILGIVPPATLIGVLAWRPLISLEIGRHASRPSLFVLFAVPGFALALRALKDVNLLDQPPVLLLGGISIGLTVALAQIDGLLTPSWAALFVPTVAIFVYLLTLVVESDREFDDAPPQTALTTVAHMTVLTGRYNNNAYKILPAPWSRNIRPSQVDVPAAFYASTKIGDTICVSIHPGALHIRWYTLDRCAHAMSNATPGH